MLLAVDVGNTNTGLAVFDGGKLRADWRFATAAGRTADEYAAAMLPLFASRGVRFADVGGMAICSVVPAAVDAFVRLAGAHFGIPDPLVLSPETDSGIRVNYTPVSDVGADRIANAAAAHARYGEKVIVVDFGTATTLDAVADDGSYLGGAIAPGIQISLDALIARAARLTGVELAAPSRAIGDTTSSSLRSGVIFGFAGQVDALVDRFQAEMGGGAKVIATGGLAPVIAPCSRTIQSVDEMLTLEGIRIIYERIRP